MPTRTKATSFHRCCDTLFRICLKTAIESKWGERCFLLAANKADLKNGQILFGWQQFGPPTYTFVVRAEDGQISNVKVTSEDVLYKEFVQTLSSLEPYDEATFRFSRLLRSSDSSVSKILNEKIEEFLDIPLDKLERKIGPESYRKLDFEKRGFEALKLLIKEKSPHVEYFLRLAQIAYRENIKEFFTTGLLTKIKLTYFLVQTTNHSKRSNYHLRI